MKIEDMTIEQLEAALRDRRKMEEARRKRERQRFNRKVVENRDALLELISHDRSSCKSRNNSGFHPEHGCAYCNRCALESLSEYDDDVQVIINVQISKVPENEKAIQISLH
jgi:hypothetical protein